MVKSRGLLVSIIFLITALAGYWLFLSIAWHNAKPLKLSVTAYKSKNWLYGNHYLYRVQLDSETSCMPEDKYVCLKPIQYSSTPFGSSCFYSLRGECLGKNHFVTKANRFYLPHSIEAAQQFYYQLGTIRLKVSDYGPVFVNDFKIGINSERS